jgi:hypothetical protein
MAREESHRRPAESVQLGPSDALRLAAIHQRLANALRSSPQSFVSLFALEPTHIQALTSTDPANDKVNAIDKSKAQPDQALPPGAHTEENQSLDIHDALRLAGSDERFAGAFLSYPEDFTVVFDLSTVEILAIRKVSELDTVEMALAKVREELQDSLSQVEHAGYSLNVNDALSLAAADARFAAALRASPASFRTIFHLTDSDVSGITESLNRVGIKT